MAPLRFSTPASCRGPSQRVSGPARAAPPGKVPSGSAWLLRLAGHNSYKVAAYRGFLENLLADPETVGLIAAAPQLGGCCVRSAGCWASILAPLGCRRVHVATTRKRAPAPSARSKPTRSLPASRSGRPARRQTTRRGRLTIQSPSGCVVRRERGKSKHALIIPGWQQLPGYRDRRALGIRPGHSATWSSSGPASRSLTTRPRTEIPAS